MAVKGRSRSGAAPGAPKPRIEPRKLPVTKRRWFRRTAAIVGILLLLFIALTIWGRVSRANALRDYERRLATAARPFQKHNEPTSQTNITETLTAFQGGQLRAADLRTRAKEWETDLASARDAIRKLDPPDELDFAQDVYAEAMDSYIGVARLATTAADQKDAVDGTRDARTKRSLQRRLEAIQSSAEEARVRAEKLRGMAQGEIDELKAAWGLGAAA